MKKLALPAFLILAVALLSSGPFAERTSVRVPASDPGKIAEEGSAGCATVRLDETDADVRSIPVWDQGMRPACYLYSASFFASLWARKQWGEHGFTEDPAAVYPKMMKAANVDAILDAENGRTCMSLAWDLRDIAARLGVRNPEMPECRMYGMIRSRKRQDLRPAAEIEGHMHGLLRGRSARPFAIEFCSGVLDESGSYIRSRRFRSTLTYLNTSAASENLTSGCGFHVAVVVGQEERQGRCQFRVRNSWGTWAGDRGYYWVDADQLAKNTLRVVSLHSR